MTNDLTKQTRHRNNIKEVAVNSAHSATHTSDFIHFCHFLIIPHKLEPSSLQQSVQYCWTKMISISDSKIQLTYKGYIICKNPAHRLTYDESCQTCRLSDELCPKSPLQMSLGDGCFPEKNLLGDHTLASHTQTVHHF